MPPAVADAVLRSPPKIARSDFRQETGAILSPVFYLDLRIFQANTDEEIEEERKKSIELQKKTERELRANPNKS